MNTPDNFNTIESPLAVNKAGYRPVIKSLDIKSRMSLVLAGTALALSACDSGKDQSVNISPDTPPVQIQSVHGDPFRIVTEADDDYVLSDGFRRATPEEIAARTCPNDVPLMSGALIEKRDKNGNLQYDDNGNVIMGHGPMSCPDDEETES